MITAEHIVKRYADHTALNDVSLSVPDGSIFGLLGPNGAGKTSLIRIINQITAPDSGQILLNGRKINSEDISRIGYLPEERGLYKKMKVGEQAIYLARLKGMTKHDAVKELHDWFEKLDMTAWWNKKVEELSKGMAQKLQFVITVVHKPELLILDEPFSGFDPINTELIKSEILRLRDEGTTILLSTHNMNSVEEICSHISLIHNAHTILEGKVGDLKKQFSEQVYKISFRGQMLGFTNALWTAFELLGHEVEEDRTIARVKMLDGHKPNDLLRVALPHIEILELTEVVPSMHDIFIKAVEGPETSEENKVVANNKEDDNE